MKRNIAIISITILGMTIASLIISIASVGHASGLPRGCSNYPIGNTGKSHCYVMPDGWRFQRVGVQCKTIGSNPDYYFASGPWKGKYEMSVKSCSSGDELVHVFTNFKR